MRAALESTRRTGVAYDREKAYKGLGCVASPIRSAGRAIGAVSVTGPIERMHAHSVASEVRKTALAVRFATRGADKFDGAGFVPDACGLPTLPDASVSLRCAGHSKVEGGDHIVLIGHVEEVAIGSEPHVPPIGRGELSMTQQEPRAFRFPRPRRGHRSCCAAGAGHRALTRRGGTGRPPSRRRCTELGMTDRAHGLRKRDRASR